MDHKILFVFLIFVIFGCQSEQNTSQFSDQSPPETNIFFGDPFILNVNGTYYIYGTGQQSDTGITVYRSDNLTDWEGPVGSTDGFALHQDDVYGEHSFWAPEVYELGDRYYIFFSVEEHMAIATSDNPEGPFTQENPSVLRDHKSIDHHLFIDEDGTKYIFFANFKNGLEIWGAELEDDFSSIREETFTKLMEPSQEWEESPKEPVGRVNEGPYVLKESGRYYMSYSANHYASQDYGIGWAHADEPLGDWTKSEENPVIQNPDSLVGTGHSSFFRDTNNQLHIVYHAHFDTTEVHPRKAYINKVELVKQEGNETLLPQIIPPRIVPKVQPEE